MFSELPNVDRILQLLDDILLVRSFIILDLEGELYEKLINVYRDPRLLIKYTRDEREVKANYRKRRLKPPQPERQPNEIDGTGLTSSEDDDTDIETSSNSNESSSINQTQNDETRSILKQRL